MHKRVLGLTVLLALVALAATAGAAQAAPHWYKGKPLVGSGPVSVATKGTLTFNAIGTTIKCKLTDTELIWNPAGGGAGEDLMTAFTLSKCKIKEPSPICPPGAAEVTANGLPWQSKLFTTPPPNEMIRDEIIKVRLLISCSSGAGDEFEGTLTPLVGNGTLIFGGPGGGTLFDSFSNPMTVTGVDKLIAPPGKITAKDP